MIRTYLPAMALLLSSSLAIAGNSTGLAFLKISPDAGSAGNAELALPLQEGPLQAIVNPTLDLSGVGQHFGITKSRWIFETDYHVLSWSGRVGPVTLGADLRLFSIEDFELREDSNPEPSGTFRGDGLAYGLRCSGDVAAGWRAGAALRRVQEKIYNDDSSGWSTDLALDWRASREGASLPVADGMAQNLNLRFGVLARNVGSVSEYESVAPDLPRTLSLMLGGTRSFWREGWALDAGLELRHLQDDKMHPHLGCELQAGPAVRLRAGYMSDYDDRGLTAGLGFIWKDLQLDYAYLPFDNGLEDIHRFSFTFGFLGGI